MRPKPSLKTLYRQERFPIFQNRVYDSKNDSVNCPVGNIHLVQDSSTGLIFNSEFSESLMAYDSNYQNDQSCSEYFQSHLHEVARIISRNFNSLPLFEVGCGKGVFLDMLISQGFDISGCDPAYEGNNPLVIKDFFAPGYLSKSKGIILRHVLEHIPKPLVFLSKLKNASPDDALVYIEVPCFDWICRHRAWYDIYYEHVNYFRLSDFFGMFQSIVDSGTLFDGQYLYIVAKLSSFNMGCSRIDVDFPIDFTGKVNRLATSIRPPVNIWGGASKGVIFALLMQRAGCRIGRVVDINPAKQGKYLPAAGVLIESPAEALSGLSPGDDLYIMNSNYLEEIKRMTGNLFNYVSIDNE